jgi:hypothetical protein
MATESINLQLDAEAANVFRAASPEEQNKLRVLFGIWLKEYGRTDTKALKKTMDEISANAKSRGLTPEVLSSVLEDE